MSPLLFIRFYRCAPVQRVELGGRLMIALVSRAILGAL